MGTLRDGVRNAGSLLQDIGAACEEAEPALWKIARFLLSVIAIATVLIVLMSR